MTLILLAAIAVLWIVICFAVVMFGGRFLPNVWWTYLIRAIVFVVLIPLPLMDEIIAGPEFEKLCRQRASVSVDLPNPRGRTVSFKDSERMDLQLTGLRVVQTRRNYADVDTGELVYHYVRLDATGGWFARSIAVSEGRVPLLFEGTCQPNDVDTIDSKLGVKRVNRS